MQSPRADRPDPRAGHREKEKLQVSPGKPRQAKVRGRGPDRPPIRPRQGKSTALIPVLGSDTSHLLL
ncbi:hypothetical protein NDU88_001107 [Pleurodeles waltl]|uniref:Uncharacterized protein n=1 Tax=Pleurodeles waltl TaxID=8319 RepID=A0AAV7V961_PLEWA|nr:hypothetical protein NDU88_001107 [Pleurodeles waltl]